jgi:predicted RNase H-like nuclease (RuvC/YqgF family)
MGITELNPQVQEEITRLRRENKRLLQEVDSVSDDSVRDLRYSLANEERLRSHFEGEFRDISKAKVELQQCLDRTQTRVDALSVELADEHEVSMHLFPRLLLDIQYIQLLDMQGMSIFQLHVHTLYLINLFIYVE